MPRDKNLICSFDHCPMSLNLTSATSFERNWNFEMWQLTKKKCKDVGHSSTSCKAFRKCFFNVSLLVPLFRSSDSILMKIKFIRTNWNSIGERFSAWMGRNEGLKSLSRRKGGFEVKQVHTIEFNFASSFLFQFHLSRKLSASQTIFCSFILRLNVKIVI